MTLPDPPASVAPLASSMQSLAPPASSPTQLELQTRKMQHPRQIRQHPLQRRDDPFYVMGF
jgi:hypothetical protein